MVTFTITVDDATLEQFAELVASKVPEQTSSTDAPAPLEANGPPAAQTSAEPAPGASNPPAAAEPNAIAESTSTTDDAAAATAGGFAGAVIDPRTHRMVMPDETTNDTEPANPAPEPS